MWLVRLRWIALAGVVLTTTAATMLRVVAEPRPLLAIALAAGLLNARWWLNYGRASRPSTVAREERAIFGQLLIDLLVLTLLLYFSGGVENPFSTFFAFHMALAAMLLSRRAGILTVVAACLLYCSLLLGELVGALPHHTLRLLPDLPDAPDRLAQSIVLVEGKSAAVLGMLVGVYYFVRSVVERHGRAEEMRREQERVAALREPLARVGEVSAGLAHTIRNPLHGLINCVDMLSAKADPEEAETLALMSEALERIEKVTGRLLGLARDAPPRKSPTDVDALVTQTLAALSPRTRSSAARIETRLGAVGEVELDALGISEALTNVLCNALDACAEGGTIAIRTSSNSTPDPSIVIEVSDDGTGVAPEHLEKVFAPFFTTKSIGKGTGLGLAIARRVIEQHGGRVTLDSAPGTGTRVKLIIPRCAQEREEATQ